jgi:nucleotide-binding universal stress UspA family protein
MRPSISLGDACLTRPVAFSSPPQVPETSAAGIGTRHDRSAGANVLARHILVTNDGSGSAEAALPFAAHAIRACGASRVTLMRVLEPNRSMGTRIDPLEWALAKATVEADLARLAGQIATPTAEVARVVGEGRADEQILHVAATEDVDLIVLSTHGRGEAHAVPLGSTARKVVSRGHASLLLVPTDARHEVERVFVPLDCSQRAECVLPLAVRLASTLDAELVLGHVVPRPDLLQRLPTSDRDLELATELTEHNRERAEAYLGQVRQRLQRQGVRVDARTSSDANPARGVETMADDVDADLILLCAHGATCQRGDVYGTVPSRLLTSLRRPTWVIQDLAAHNRGDTAATSGTHGRAHRV